MVEIPPFRLSDIDYPPNGHTIADRFSGNYRVDGVLAADVEFPAGEVAFRWASRNRSGWVPGCSALPRTPAAAALFPSLATRLWPSGLCGSFVWSLVGKTWYFGRSRDHDTCSSARAIHDDFIRLMAFRGFRGYFTLLWAGLHENINDIYQRYISWYYHDIFVWKYHDTYQHKYQNIFSWFLKFIYLHKIFLRYGELINIPWACSSAPNLALIGERGQYRRPQMSKFAQNCA